MTVAEIVKWWLRENGFDGLHYDEWCGCCIDDLAPCGEFKTGCEAGYKKIDSTYEGCDFSIVPEKPKQFEKGKQNEKR